MKNQNLWETFDLDGRLLLPETTLPFGEIPWSEHPSFEGVALKHLVTSAQTQGQFSFHLVRIAPNKKIGLHVHPEQLETHEVLVGSGWCLNDGVKLRYESGTISIFPKSVPHEVTAGEEGLYLFAKFFPALV